MNRLVEIWSEKGFPIKTSEEYNALVSELQSRLDEIYETFTGDVNITLKSEALKEGSFSNDSIYPLQKNPLSSQRPWQELFS